MITGARAPIALELSRSLAADGHRVIMADCLKFTVSRWSNSVAKYYTLPAPAVAPQDFLLALQHIIENEKVDHLIPICEEAFYISRYKKQINCKVWAAPFELMDELHNKATFIDLARPFFAVPHTIEASSFNDWSNTEKYVFKKKYSRFGTSVILNGDTARCRAAMQHPQDWIVQERILGREVCVYSVWDEGQMKAFACYHPLYRYGKGAGIFFEPQHIEGLQQRVMDFGLSCRYHGQLSLDIIIREDIQYVLECNPRGTSGAHLLNRNLGRAFVDDSLLLPSSNLAYCIGYAMLLKHPLSYFNKNVRQARDVIFSVTDLMPFLAQVLSVLEITRIALIKRIPWLLATTQDIEWNGDKVDNE